MGRKKIATTVYLTEDQLDSLKELSNKTRAPIAEYIRLGIDLVLEKHRHQLAGQMSLFDQLSPDKSEEPHERYSGTQDS